MRKLPLVLAAAVAFDLGAVVLSSHAAESFTFQKVQLDATHTASGCKTGGGTVVNGFCQLPKGVALQDFHFGATHSLVVTKDVDKASPNLATKAPAKKEEAKKE